MTLANYNVTVMTLWGGASYEKNDHIHCCPR